jgi:hypothetical protein
VHFIHGNLPGLGDPARALFDQIKPLLLKYAEERISYAEFKSELPDAAQDQEE